METTIQGTFVARGYTGLVNQDTEHTLADMLRSTYPDGTILKMFVSCEFIGRMPICTQHNRYGKCNTVLTEDGDCPNEDTHIVKEEVTAK